ARPLAAGLNGIAGERLVGPDVFSGLRDTLDLVFDEAPWGPARCTGSVSNNSGTAPADVVAKLARVRALLRDIPGTLAGSFQLLQRMSVTAEELVGSAEDRAGGDVKWWARAFEDQCRYALEELRYLAPWVELPTPA